MVATSTGPSSCIPFDGFSYAKEDGMSECTRWDTAPRFWSLSRALVTSYKNRFYSSYREGSHARDCGPSRRVSDAVASEVSMPVCEAGLVSSLPKRLILARPLLNNPAKELSMPPLAFLATGQSRQPGATRLTTTCTTSTRRATITEAPPSSSSMTPSDCATRCSTYLNVGNT